MSRARFRVEKGGKGAEGCHLPARIENSWQLQLLEPPICSRCMWCPSKSHLGMKEQASPAFTHLPSWRQENCSFCHYRSYLATPVHPLAHYPSTGLQFSSTPVWTGHCHVFAVLTLHTIWVSLTLLQQSMFYLHHKGQNNYTNQWNFYQQEQLHTFLVHVQPAKKK